MVQIAHDLGRAYALWVRDALSRKRCSIGCMRAQHAAGARRVRNCDEVLLGWLGWLGMT